MIDVVFFDEQTDGSLRLIPLVFDATPQEQHRSSSIATEDEIETGASTTDHLRPERRSLTFEAVITDIPIASNDAITVFEEATELAIPGGRSLTRPARFESGEAKPAEFEEDAGRLVRATILGAGGEVTRVDDALALLEDVRQRALLAIVTTRFETYEDMALLEMVATRTAADGSWLRAQFTFRELGFQSVEIVEDPLPLRPRDRMQEEKGAQETTPAPDRLVSGLSRIFG